MWLITVKSLLLYPYGVRGILPLPESNLNNRNKIIYHSDIKFPVY